MPPKTHTNRTLRPIVHFSIPSYKQNSTRKKGRNLHTQTFNRHPAAPQKLYVFSLVQCPELKIAQPTTTTTGGIKVKIVGRWFIIRRVIKQFFGAEHKTTKENYFDGDGEKKEKVNRLWIQCPLSTTDRTQGNQLDRQRGNPADESRRLRPDDEYTDERKYETWNLCKTLLLLFPT